MYNVIADTDSIVFKTQCILIEITSLLKHLLNEKSNSSFDPNFMTKRFPEVFDTDIYVYNLPYVITFDSDTLHKKIVAHVMFQKNIVEYNTKIEIYRAVKVLCEDIFPAQSPAFGDSWYNIYSQAETIAK
jgi:16S rRNA A1518/A1519 N6-dimethyltransferase RsmA/KsgA/DIM1 with predicted DNA glycosylase/AP lyase activity